MNYYIQGSKKNAKQIENAFEKLGYSTSLHTFFDEDTVFITLNGNICECNYGGPINELIKTHPDYKELELPVESKFKVGDEIKTDNTIETIAEVDLTTRSYCCESGRTIWFENQDLWHLAPKPHYDIANFKPFDKVLCRGHNRQAWRPSLYGCYDTSGKYPMFVCATANYLQCIPFNDKTKHLLGTTDKCPEEYINW